MTADELEKNLGTIAKSGSLEFKKDDKLKEEDINIIGQFGVGFYSAFMVAKKVEVISKAYGETVANKWISSGAEGFDIISCEKDGHGTTIKLYLKDSTENDNFDTYLEEYTIKNLVKKYSDYIRYPINMDITKNKAGENGEQESVVTKETLNSMVPLWKKNKSQITAEEYNNFYKDNFYDSENLLLNKGKYEFGNITNSTLSHFYEKLILLKDKLHTKTALDMAEERHNFMLLFLDEFYNEI